MSADGSHSPLAQFELHPLLPLQLGGVDVSFTNASLWMVFTVLGIIAFFGLAARKPALVPGRFQGVAEMTMDLVHNSIKETAGYEALKYFPAIFTLFCFILFANLFGMIPFSFAVTSHIIVTFALALCVFLAVTVIMIARHGVGGFLHYFLPQGTPWWLAPIMYLIEVFSYLARPVSLSIRLAANMMAGHTLLKVIAGFVFVLGVGGVAPLALLIMLTGMELGIAVLQAYIFTILTCVYLHDAIHCH